MSIVVRREKYIPGPILEQPVAARPSRPAPRSQPAEAPDAGRRLAEAPEANTGRGHIMETAFTHGRSRS